MKYAGFTLLELLMALLIGSLLTSLLLTSFFQVQRNDELATNIMNLNGQVALLNNQLERDISGIFIPVQAIEKNNQQPEPKADKSQDKKSAATNDEKKFKSVFKASHKNNMLSELSFITNNPLRVYEFAENTPIKTNVARVVYHLETNEDKKSYSLIRQEGSQLDLQAYAKNAQKPIKGYKLIDAIKTIALEFAAPVFKKDADAQPQTEFKTSAEWDSDKRKEQEKESKIPQFVKVSVSLWDDKREIAHDFTFNYQVAGFAAALDFMQATPSTAKPIGPATEKKDAKTDKTKIGTDIKITTSSDTPTGAVKVLLTSSNPLMQDLINSLTSNRS